MFTQSCFIRKNSPEIREKLQKLGYYVYDSDMNKDSPAEWCTVIETEADYAGIWNKEPTNKEKFLDCGENEELFLALAALRDDTDKNQWFIYDSMDAIIESFRVYEWFVCNEDRIEDMLFYDSHYLNTHKATAEEIIEHFKHEG